MYLGACLASLGRPAEAETLLRTAADRMEQVFGRDGWQAAEASAYRAAALARAGRVVEARALARAAVGNVRRTRGPDHWMTRRIERQVRPIGAA